jgi:hypothetical protein
MAQVIDHSGLAGVLKMGLQQVLGKVELCGRCHRGLACHGRSHFLMCIKKLVERSNWLYKCIILRMT